MLALLRDDLRDPVLVRKREFDGAKSRVRRFAEALEERHFVEQKRQVGGEARHRRIRGSRRLRCAVEAAAFGYNSCLRLCAVTARRVQSNRNSYVSRVPPPRFRSPGQRARDRWRARRRRRRRACRARRGARAALAARAHGVRRRRSSRQGRGVSCRRRAAAARLDRRRSCAADAARSSARVPRDSSCSAISCMRRPAASPRSPTRSSRGAARHAALDVVLVRGNHDARAGDPPATGMLRCVDEPYALPPFLACHMPGAPPSGLCAVRTPAPRRAHPRQRRAIGAAALLRHRRIGARFCRRSGASRGSPNSRATSDERSSRSPAARCSRCRRRPMTMS